MTVFEGRGRSFFDKLGSERTRRRTDQLQASGDCSWCLAASLHTPASTTPKRQPTLATDENRTHSRTTLLIIHLSRPHWTKRPLPPPPPVCRVLAAAPAQLRPPPEQLPPAVMLRSAARGLRVAVLRTPSSAPAKWVSPPLLILIPFPSSAWSSLILHLLAVVTLDCCVAHSTAGSMCLQPRLIPPLPHLRYAA